MHFDKKPVNHSVLHVFTKILCCEYDLFDMPAGVATTEASAALDPLFADHVY